MQNENTKETRVTLTIGDTVIPATLNNTVTARAFIERLPFTVTASKAEYDFCGTAKELACDDSERQAGWKNGDIGYSNGWFALFHSGEEQSGSYTTEMIIGHIDDEYLGTVRGLSGRIEITVAQADENTIKLKISANNRRITVDLYDSPVTRDLVSLLPLTMDMHDYMQSLKYGYLPRTLSEEGGRRQTTFEAGDVTYYPSNKEFILFYKNSVRLRSDHIIIGKITSDLETVRGLSGRIEITVAQADE